MTEIVEARLWLEHGCSQDDGEVIVEWRPVNAWINDPEFSDEVREAVDEWLAEHTMKTEVLYELTFERVREDYGQTRYFKVTECRAWSEVQVDD